MRQSKWNSPNNYPSIYSQTHTRTHSEIHIIVNLTRASSRKTFSFSFHHRSGPMSCDSLFLLQNGFFSFSKHCLCEFICSGKSETPIDCHIQSYEREHFIHMINKAICTYDVHCIMYPHTYYVLHLRHIRSTHMYAACINIIVSVIGVVTKLSLLVAHWLMHHCDTRHINRREPTNKLTQLMHVLIHRITKYRSTHKHTGNVKAFDHVALQLYTHTSLVRRTELDENRLPMICSWCLVCLSCV